MTAVPLKRRASLVTSCADAGELPIVTLDLVETGTGRLMTDKLPVVSMPSAGAALVQPGDVLFGKLRPYLAKSALLSSPAYASTELLAIRPTERLNPRFLAYLVQARPFVKWTVASSEGTKMPRTSWDKVGSYLVEDTPLERQRAIADFLDTETARIDGLIAKKRRQILLGRERLSALLENFGWKPGAKEMRLNRLVRRFVDYRGATPEKADVGIPLVTAGHIKNGRVDLAADPQFVSQETYTSWMSRGFPSVGDVLMTMEAPLGEVAQVDQLPIALAQRVILMKPDDRFVTADFLALLLRTASFQSQLAAAGTGSTALGIRSDRLRALSLPVPSPDEQVAAVARVRGASEQIRRLERHLDAQIRLLHEHRQALITAAVTGELEVPGVAA